jgi:hypothetical protein
MKKVSQIWFNIQGFLFPFIEKEIEEPLTEKLKQLVATLELLRIEDFVHIPEYWLGQSPKKPQADSEVICSKSGLQHGYYTGINRQVENHSCFTKNMRVGKSQSNSS